MTRYFMDISEAARLIIQAAALTSGGDIFMLDMGDRIRIDDLAKKMIRMRGLRPEIDIPIVYTGVRAGEKLHEELAYADEERQSTEHPSIHRSVRTSRSEITSTGVGIGKAVDDLLVVAGTGDRQRLASQLLELTRCSSAPPIEVHAQLSTGRRRRHRPMIVSSNRAI
jgi:FlaA1/EpsC-like NDP-sugar epimerase